VFYALSWFVGAIDGLRAPDWLAPWIPPELALASTSMLSALSPAIEAALTHAPALAGGLSAAVWPVWGIGSALIVILGLVCSRLITVLRRRPSAFAPSSMGPATTS
jgi:threonine/homoserine/homoserine lactone efflux protein